jgi:hypothetical protein
MKRFLAVVLILCTLSAVFANPRLPNLIDMIYFPNDSDAVRIVFSPQLNWLGTQNVHFWVGTSTMYAEINFDTYEPIWTELSGTGVSPQQGSVNVGVDDLIYDSATWGPGIENHFSSLQGYQCARRASLPGLDYPIWAKDYHANAGEFMNPSARSTIIVNCINANGGVANVPVYLWNLWNPWASTDESGQANLSIYSMKVNIRVTDPFSPTNALVTTFFAEPDSIYTFTLQLSTSSAEDPEMQVPRGNFSIYPSVLHGSQNSPLHLEYDAKLLAAAQVELYDLKGRLIGSQDYSGNSMTWQLPKLSSGVYFLRLNSGTRNLGIQKLIVLK